MLVLTSSVVLCAWCVGTARVSSRLTTDWSFTAPSRVTYYMQHVVFTAVIADATMLERAIDADVYSVGKARQKDAIYCSNTYWTKTIPIYSNT